MTEPRPASDDQQRAARRDSLRNLLDRLQRMGLTETEAHLLRQHVEAETRDADTARARVRNLADRIQQGVPWTANADDTARHIHAALDGPTAAVDEPTTPTEEWCGQKAGRIPHPPHKYMRNRTVYQCPGDTTPTAPGAEVTALENRLRLAHQARRAKEHQLDGIRRALCDAGFMNDDDPYSHADLEDVIRQAAPRPSCPDPIDCPWRRGVLDGSAPEPEPAHNDGPSIADCRSADRVWPLQRNGE